MADDSLYEKFGELNGTLKAFMANQEAAVARIEVAGVETGKIARAAHKRIDRMHLIGKAVVGTLAVGAAGVGWVWNHGKQAVEVGKDIIHHGGK